MTGLTIAFSRVSFSLKYRRREKEDWLILEVSAFWGLFKYRIAEPAVRLGAEGETAGVELEAKAGREPTTEVSYFAGFPLILRLLWDWRRILARHWTALAYLWRRLQVTRLEWHTVVGTGEPSTTGIVGGLMWGAADVLLRRCFPRLTSPASVSIKSDFFTPAFSTSLDLAASFQVRHLMGAGICFINSLRKK